MKIKKVLSLFLALLISISAIIFNPIIASAEDELTKTQTLYSLEDYSFFQQVWCPRGDTHDRQHLGIYLNAGDTLRIHITGVAPASALTLKLMSDDSAKETETFTIPTNGDWVDITATDDCVPMIISPIDNNLAEYQVEFETANTHEMPVYVEGESNQAEYFSKLDATTIPFSIAESDKVILLIPSCDFEALKVTEFGTLTAMFEYYANMLDQYDRFAGLDDSEVWNKKIGSRYLIKADASGYGEAYYCENFVAMNSSSMSRFFRPGWILTHELGHGYGLTATYAELGDMDVNEVWNNVYGYYYEILTIPEADHWLKMTDNYLKTYESYRVNNGYLGTGYDAFTWRLYFWVNLFDKLGPEQTMALFNQKYREDYYNGNNGLTGINLFVKDLTEVSGYNLIPYFNSWGLNVADNIKNNIILSGEYENIYSLRALTATDEQAQAIADNLGIDNIYNLVSTQEAMGSGLTGSLTLKFNIDNVDEIRGKKIEISDGVNVVKEVIIRGKELSLELPIGAYNVILPESNSGKVVANEQYSFMTVTADTEKVVDINYKRHNGTAFCDSYQIQYKGLGDWVYFNASYDLSDGVMTATTNEGAPHSYFDGSSLPLVYSTFSVFDENGNEVYSKIHNGNESSPETQTFDIAENYTIVLHRAEPSRTSITEALTSFIGREEFENMQADITLKITADGLKAVSGATGHDDDYFLRVKHYMDNIIKNEPDKLSDPRKLATEKAEITGAVEEKLTPEQKNEFLVTYSGIYPFESGKLVGDANFDGKIDIKDATIIQKHCADIIINDNINLLTADANEDGDVNGMDVTKVQKKVAQII